MSRLKSLLIVFLGFGSASRKRLRQLDIVACGQKEKAALSVAKNSWLFFSFLRKTSASRHALTDDSWIA